MTARTELPRGPAGAKIPPLHQVARWSQQAQRTRVPFPIRQRLSDLYSLLFGAAVFAGMGYQILTGAYAEARAEAELGPALGAGLSLRVDFLPLLVVAAGSLALLAGSGARTAAFRSGAEQHWPATALLVGAAHLQRPFLLGLPRPGRHNHNLGDKNTTWATRNRAKPSPTWRARRPTRAAVAQLPPSPTSRRHTRLTPAQHP